MTELQSEFEKEYLDKIEKEGNEINGLMWIKIKKDLYIKWLEEKVLNNG